MRNTLAHLQRRKAGPEIFYLLPSLMNTLLTQVQAVRRAFLQIASQVEGVVSVEWGANNSPEGKNAGFTHCVLMSFENEAARRRYLPTRPMKS